MLIRRFFIFPAAGDAHLSIGCAARFLPESSSHGHKFLPAAELRQQSTTEYIDDMLSRLQMLARKLPVYDVSGAKETRLRTSVFAARALTTPSHIFGWPGL